jgi:pyrroloquinoline quinone (PQQ) biosynthesis protein C
MARTESLVETALKDRRLVRHPFYRRWEEGRLTFDDLRGYADQYRHFEASLPAILATIAERLPEGAPREAVEANLADELGPPSHLELFERFARHYGADGDAPSPGMAGVLDAYRACLDDGPACALAGVAAYEAQGAEVAQSKAEGLELHYGATDGATEFWRVHAEVEDDHARWLLEAHPVDDGAAAVGAARVAAAWWAFLDEREARAAA